MNPEEYLQNLYRPDIPTIYRLTMNQTEINEYLNDMARGLDVFHRVGLSEMFTTYQNAAGELRAFNEPFPLNDPWCTTNLYVTPTKQGTSLISTIDWIVLQDSKGKTSIQIRQLQEESREVDAAIRKSVSVKSARHTHFSLGFLITDLIRREIITEDNDITISYLEAVPYTDPDLKYFGRPSNFQILQDQHFSGDTLSYPPAGRYHGQHSNFSTDNLDVLKRYESLTPYQKSEIALRQTAVLIPRYRQRFGKYPSYLPVNSPPLGTIWEQYLRESTAAFTNTGITFPAQLMISAIKKFEFTGEESIAFANMQNIPS